MYKIFYSYLRCVHVFNLMMTDPVAQDSLETTLRNALNNGALDIIDASDGLEPYTLLAELDTLMARKKLA